MRIGIIGSRKRTDRQTIYNCVDSLDLNDTIVSGGCYGPDKWAEERAKQRGMPEPIIHEPKIHPYMTYHEKVQEFYKRNRKIVNDSDKIIAFVADQNTQTGGTWYTIKHAKKMKIPVEIK